MEQKEILDRISELEKEISLLKKELPAKKTITVPKVFDPIFDNAQKVVEKYFDQLTFNPEEGSIKIDDERYILVRASSLSNEFFKSFEENYPDKTKEEVFSLTKDFLFDVGHVIGLEDAKKFHQKMNLRDPISKLSAGPIHFAYAGWASVEILPESNPSPDKNFFLKYKHPYSFEAESWIKDKDLSDKPVCIMNAAYSSGWCEASFGIPLTSVEIECKAKGDDCCTFIMAQPTEIGRFLDLELKKTKSAKTLQIPSFFERQFLKDRLMKNEELLKTAQNLAKIGAWEFDLITQKLTWSDELFEIFEIDKADITNLEQLYYSKIGKEDQIILGQLFQACATEGENYELEHDIFIRKGEIKNLYCIGKAHFDDNGNIVKVSGIAQDVTQAKNKNKALAENLKEKEVLLKEVHHRVKNNLQIISSLLNLQSNFIDNEFAASLYFESQNRIKSIASVHELLYQSEDISKISFKAYLNKLINDLIYSYLGENSNVKLTIEADVELNIDTSIPLGLLVNEIVSNSLKHGIKGQENMDLYVSIIKNESKNYFLAIGDNGTGFSGFNESKEMKSMGLMLIKELSDQLSGEIKKLDQKGTHYELMFKPN